MSQEVTTQQKVRTPVVTAPKIFIDSSPEAKESGFDVAVQWFGSTDESAAQFIEGKQFWFPIGISTQKCWQGRPDLFEVVFIGKVKDWPNPEAAQAVANMATHGDLEASVIYLTSIHYPRNTPSGIGPASFVIPIQVALGDWFGVIEIKEYKDMNALDAAILAVRKSQT